MYHLSRFALLAGAALSLNACTGDYHLTQTSSSSSTRVAATAPNPADATSRGGADTAFTSNRVYQITRLDSPDGPSGEWRALGSTIRQTGDYIEFTELGSGRYVSFTSPHQVSATGSKSDRRSTVEGAPTVPGSSEVATNLN